MVLSNDHVFRAGHVTCSDHTTLDGGALRHAPLRLLDLESLCSGRSDQSDWLYQVRPLIHRVPCDRKKWPTQRSAEAEGEVMAM